jgi:hypothetical protein
MDEEGVHMPTFLRDTFSYLILALAAAFTLMIFIPPRFYAVSVAPATPAIASTALSTTQVAPPRHQRSSHLALERFDRHSAAAGMLALMFVKTQAQGDQPSH